MPLTEEQQKKIREILEDYRKQADKIVADHHAEVKKILNDLDQKKIQELEGLIGKLPASENE